MCDFIFLRRFLLFRLLIDVHYFGMTGILKLKQFILSQQSTPKPWIKLQSSKKPLISNKVTREFRSKGHFKLSTKKHRISGLSRPTSLAQIANSRKRWRFWARGCMFVNGFGHELAGEPLHILPERALWSVLTFFPRFLLSRKEIGPPTGSREDV